MNAESPSRYKTVPLHRRDALLRAPILRLALRACVLSFAVQVLHADPLPGTQPLEKSGDLSAEMVAGISRYLDREIIRNSTARFEKWKARDATAAGSMRDLLRKRLGMSDPPVGGGFEIAQGAGPWPAKTNSSAHYRAVHVRWRVFEDVWGDGLLLQPAGEPKAIVVALPDADQDPEQIAGLLPGVPEQLQFAYRLVQHGCTVLVPRLIDRRTEWSGTALMDRHTNEPHREWIYRQAFEVGRTLTGYEVQKVLSAIDALDAMFKPAGQDRTRPILGVAGYGEGGLIALHVAALDPRIEATLVSGHFGPHDQLWKEPLYRNVFGYQREFADAELAALIAPRPVIVEHAIAPAFTSPPPVEKNQRACAAPGLITTPLLTEVEAEVKLAQDLHAQVSLIKGAGPEALVPISDAALHAFLRGLDFPKSFELNRQSIGNPAEWAPGDARELQQLAVRELERHTQLVLSKCEFTRNAQDLWKKLKPGDEWTTAQKEARRHFEEEVIGKLPADFLPPNPHSRLVLEKEKWTAYDVVLDVHPDLFAWGVLLLPKDLKPGERRPVVVCQHGLEGVPMDTVTDDKTAKAYAPYKAFAAQLADQGFIVFAPHNPYRGQDAFRVLQRKAQPLGWSLFSFINAQHEVITRWLASQSFVDPERIAFYGLSYGGKSAMRIPAVVGRYCLSICSGDFNEWVRKNASIEYPGSYIFTGEYEIFEWDLGHTFNYAEMAMLIAPRPFMVERGHNDGVGTDEWVGYEYAKVRRAYDKLGIGDRTEIEWFDGPHTIHGVGTFEFLHKHLNWPPR